jgi:DNA-binding GntR family transcriptional regulator
MLDDLTFPHARVGAGESVATWVFEELSGRIIVGKLAPGEKITEEALVRDLGVSRTPLREAIKQLEELGLIVRQRNRTLRVAPLQTEELIELVRLREHVEGLAAAEAARMVAAGVIKTDALWSIIRAIEDAETHFEGLAQIDRIFDLGTAFHARLVDLSGMPRVARIHGGLQLALARYRLVNARDKRRLNHRSAEHRSILEAVESGDPSAAETAMRTHIREGLKAYTTNNDDSRDLLATDNQLTQAG